MTGQGYPGEPTTEAGQRLVGDVVQATRDLDLTETESRLLVQLVKSGIVLVEQELRGAES